MSGLTMTVPPAMPTRVIQISQAPTPTGGYRLFALCDDGSIYSLTTKADGKLGWEKLPPVPG